MRDSQKARLYAAERDAFDWGQTIPNGELQVWLEKNVLSRAWFRRRYGNQYIEVSLMRGGGRGGYGEIRLGREARNEWVMLHELAHNLAGVNAGHGPEFAGVYLRLVHHVMGREVAACLRDSYKKHRVRYNMKKWPEADRDVKRLAARPKVKAVVKPKRPAPLFTLGQVNAAAKKVGATVEFERHRDYGRKAQRNHWSLEVTAPEGRVWIAEAGDYMEKSPDGRVLSTYRYPESAVENEERFAAMIEMIGEGLA